MDVLDDDDDDDDDEEMKTSQSSPRLLGNTSVEPVNTSRPSLRKSPHTLSRLTSLFVGKIRIFARTVLEGPRRTQIRQS